MNKLTEKEIKAKMKFHDKKWDYYEKKLKKLKDEKYKIGF